MVFWITQIRGGYKSVKLNISKSITIVLGILSIDYIP
jgi:hypothetical protein